MHALRRFMILAVKERLVLGRHALGSGLCLGLCLVTMLDSGSGVGNTLTLMSLKVERLPPTGFHELDLKCGSSIHRLFKKEREFAFS